VSAPQRERVGDWLIIAGAVALFGSLFLTWSHQFSRTFLVQWGSSAQLEGLPHDPTAWQAYSAVDVLLALLAVALVITALVGGRAVRAVVVVACGIAAAFTLRALTAPPTNGANIFDPAAPTAAYVPNAPTAGSGETIALIGLGLALAGLVVSFTAD
jgi:hypothetical protein